MEKKPTSGMAVTSLVTGIIALISSFVPLLNLLSFPFVLLAIIFGAIGLWQTVKGTKGGKGIAVAGLVLGVLALLVTVVMYGSAASVADSSEATTDGTGNATEQQAQPADQAEASSDYAVTIDGCRVTEDYAGEPVAVVTYTFTNNSDDATSFMVALRPQVFQNGVELNTAIGSDWDSEKYLKDVKPGSSSTVEIGYTLDDESDLTVEVTELISFDDTILAEATFSVA
ncbi:DUF5067 domain-containing protein [Adlercreutzia sp. R21]|uniref:DUF5067 domain-containing protein n=1 Tax=Adlercreutzia wanghongyangiae TaxID=3111451 RepID=A0ABU6IKR7_9ACTN|nr:DUF5067 domain-containing protein [Adlercreutzia sp. R21]MEC4177002.1 DUF5067 domain-containing protein [Adlercreutzia sp. R7]MEC4184794.1 DUF5067 domain-containing protein [Adlercreutzia sp. R21]